MLPARVRTETGWSDACILNLSSKGLLIYSNGAAQPGTFVEVRRGTQLVIARVVWRNNQRIGLCSPDPVHVEDIIAANAAGAVIASAAAKPIERRLVPRDPDRSRARGKAAQFLVTVLIGAGLAFAAMLSVGHALATPIARVDAVLQLR